MHMGSMAVIGQNPVDNMIHICLNNAAHESVGGMPTGAAGISYAGISPRTIKTAYPYLPDCKSS